MAVGMTTENTTQAPWRAYLDQVFPGYLLSASELHAIDPDSAARFFRRLGGRAQHVELLKQSSLIAGRVGELTAFCHHLDDLIDNFPSRTHVEDRLTDGHMQGRLNLARTIAQRRAGHATRFVTRSRTRTFDLPENALVRWVAERLLEMMTSLVKARLLPRKGWGTTVLECNGRLVHALQKVPLCDVPGIDEPTGYDVQATRAAPHAGYASALDWYRAIKNSQGCDDRRLAEILARGALRPFEAFTQFELAVLTRLVQAIEAYCHATQPGQWTFQRSIVMPRRQDVARFERADGARIEVYYNQATLPLDGRSLGPRDLGMRHYFGSDGRFRPDITVLVTIPGQAPRGLVVETKLSNRLDYIRTGYQEALLYRDEYESELLDWPKAVLVASSDIKGAISRDHEVVAVDWRRWVPDEVIAALVPPGSSPVPPETAPVLLPQPLTNES